MSNEMSGRPFYLNEEYLAAVLERSRSVTRLEGLIKQLTQKVLELADGEEHEMANGALYRERKWLEGLGLKIPAPYRRMEKTRHTTTL